jgi:hypothetical protein
MLRRRPDTSWWVSDTMRELFGPQDGLESKNLQHGKVSSRRIGWFWYKNRPNPMSYATCRDETRSGCVFVREIRVKNLPSEWKYSYPSEGLMTEWKVSVRVKLRSKREIRVKFFRVGSFRVEFFQVKFCRVKFCRVESFRVEYCHPSEILLSEILPSEILPTEWKSHRRVTLRSKNPSDIKSG